MNYRGRFEKARQYMEAEDLDILLISNPTNVRYLSGYWSILPDVGLIIPGEEEPILVVPYLELGLAKATSWVSDQRYLRAYALPIEGVQQEGQTVFGELKACLTSLGLNRKATLGVELDHLSATKLADLRELTDIEIRDVSSLIPRFRMIKDQDELERLRQSACLADLAATAAIEAIRPGVTESAVAAAAVEAIWREGGRATHVVVGAGPRSAMPHPIPGLTVLEEGQLVVMDFGICFEGYWSEIARTVVVGGQPSAQQQEWFDLVQAAQHAAETGLRPGTAAGRIDRLAREVFLKAGYDGRFFNHSVGHGDGLLGADAPYIRPSDDEEVQANMVISLEPGLYFAGIGGIRLEDTFYIGETATERWTVTSQSLSLR